MEMVLSPTTGEKVKADDLTPEDAAWYCRSIIEGAHRTQIYYHGVRLMWTPSTSQSRLEVTYDHFFDTCNKSVAFYILQDMPGPTAMLFSQGSVLHNYVYRRWFRPYRSDIECRRFICKFFSPRDLPDNSATSQFNIDSIVRLNGNVCTSISLHRREYEELLASSSEDDTEGEVTSRIRWSMREITYHNAYVLQPLFRALLIIFSGADWHGEDSTVAGQLPVTLVRTGVEGGLSEPIKFDAIADKIDCYLGDAGTAVRVSLEVAIDFVMSLEVREAVALGLNPDPVAAWNAQFRPNRYVGIDREMGPSSRLVDTSRVTEWLGDGPDSDAVWGGWERRHLSEAGYKVSRSRTSTLKRRE